MHLHPVQDTPSTRTRATQRNRRLGRGGSCIYLGGTDRCQNSDPILEVSQKNGGIRGQKVDVGSPGQSEEAEGGPLGEADPWPGTDQNNRLLYE